MLVGRGKLLVRGRGLLKFWELDYLLRGISSGIQWQGKRRGDMGVLYLNGGTFNIG